MPSFEAFFIHSKKRKGVINMLLKVLICNGLSTITRSSDRYATGILVSDGKIINRDTLKVLFLVGIKNDLRNVNKICITNDTAKQYGIDLCDLFSLAADLLSCMGSISIDGDNYDYEVISDFWYDSCSNSVIITSPYLHELLLSIMYYGEALVCDVIKEVEEIIVDGDY